jgi:hypothetical protein
VYVRVRAYPPLDPVIAHFVSRASSRALAKETRKKQKNKNPWGFRFFIGVLVRCFISGNSHGNIKKHGGG